LSSAKKISQELDDIKDYLIDNKLKNINFDTLDLTEVVNEEDQESEKHSNKNASAIDGLSKETTIHEIVVALLKPELKRWLDKNLPTIVKHAVDKEIKKIIPKNE